MERLKMDRKKRRKKEQTRLLQVEGGGCLGEGGGDTVMYIKMLKVKQKADYQRHVIHCSNQAVRQ